MDIFVSYDAFIWFVILNASLLLALAMNVSNIRMTRRVPYGDGGDKAVNQAIRAHANGVEHVPIYGLTILALAFAKADNTWLWVLVLGFTGFRVLHAYGMLKRHFPSRRWGAGGSYLFQGIAIITLLVVMLF